MEEFNISISVEKVIDVEVMAETMEEAIRKAEEKVMNSNEDFAQILSSIVVDYIE